MSKKAEARAHAPQTEEEESVVPQKPHKADEHKMSSTPAKLAEITSVQTGEEEKRLLSEYKNPKRPEFSVHIPAAEQKKLLEDWLKKEQIFLDIQKLYFDPQKGINPFTEDQFKPFDRYQKFLDDTREEEALLEKHETKHGDRVEEDMELGVGRMELEAGVTPRDKEIAKIIEQIDKTGREEFLIARSGFLPSLLLELEIEAAREKAKTRDEMLQNEERLRDMPEPTPVPELTPVPEDEFSELDRLRKKELDDLQKQISRAKANLAKLEKRKQKLVREVGK